MANSRQIRARTHPMKLVPQRLRPGSRSQIHDEVDRQGEDNSFWPGDQEITNQA